MRLLYIFEVVIVLSGILLGIFVSPKKWVVILLAILDGCSLLIIAKNLLFAMSDEMYMMLPFLGEILALGTSVALIILLLKSSRKYL